ncbi:Kinesin-4 [Dactylella cylindrospora]|nr:Kinesin-4 [Dactylella cylindrospora]
MDGPHAFQVYLRLRPPHNTQSSSLDEPFLAVLPPSPTASDEDIEHGTKTQVTIHPPSNHRSQKIETFSFTEVFEETCGQGDLFEKTVVPILNGVLRDGRDGMMATLGVTGSGKLSEDQITHCNDAESDIMNCSAFMSKVISVIEPHHIPKPNSAPTKPSVESHIITPPSSSSTKYAILMSIYEVYNDKIFDLLSPSNAARRKALLFKSTRSSGDRKVVTGLRKVMVTDLYEALQVLGVGQYQRSHGETGSNDKSSRSHCFISLELKKLRKNSIKESTFTIVDLAGSERARNAKTAGDRLAEGGHINKSLMFLGQCLEISTQTSGDGKHGAKIPYRQSKLTELLFTNSYNPATEPQLASIIVTADPSGDFNATSQMLKYSALAKSSVNPRPPMQVLTGSRNVSATSQVSQFSQGSGMSGSTAVMNNEDGRPGSAMSQDAAASMIANLQRQLREAEERRKETERKLAEANAKCLQIERVVREEVTNDMEKKMRLMERKMLVKLEEGVEREEEHVDRKLDMLKRTLLESNDENDRARDVEIEQYVRELEQENSALKREIQSLKRKRTNDESPLKERAPNRLRY